MALARRRDEWERTSHIISHVRAAGFGGKWIDPSRFNPLHQTREKSPEEKEHDNREGWAMLRAGLGQLSRG